MEHFLLGILHFQPIIGLDFEIKFMLQHRYGLFSLHLIRHKLLLQELILLLKIVSLFLKFFFILLDYVLQFFFVLFFFFETLLVQSLLFKLVIVFKLHYCLLWSRVFLKLILWDKLFCILKFKLKLFDTILQLVDFCLKLKPFRLEGLCMCVLELRQFLFDCWNDVGEFAYFLRFCLSLHRELKHSILLFLS